MQKRMPSVEVCFSPAIYPLFHKKEAIVVVVDILRATSAICTAFMNGVNYLIPVGTVEEARKHKENGAFVAAERDGLVLDFADFGNSPFNFTKERVEGNEIVYSTTNGTNAIQMASGSHQVVIGSFLNLSALAQWLIAQEREVVVFCAGWKNKFSLEDTVFAGALCRQLMDSGKFSTICDSVSSSMDLWSLAESDLYQYILKAAQKQRLAKNGLDDVIEFCHTPDQTEIIPVFEEGRLMVLDEENNSEK